MTNDDAQGAVRPVAWLCWLAGKPFFSEELPALADTAVALYDEVQYQAALARPESATGACDYEERGDCYYRSHAEGADVTGGCPWHRPATESAPPAGESDDIETQEYEAHRKGPYRDDTLRGGFTYENGWRRGFRAGHALASQSSARPQVFHLGDDPRAYFKSIRPQEGATSTSDSGKFGEGAGSAAGESRQPVRDGQVLPLSLAHPAPDAKVADALAELSDADGENLAVRAFLLLYGGQAQGMTVARMQEHLRLSGFDGCWPAWTDEDDEREYSLTKAGAQEWLRHLFALAAHRKGAA